MRFSSVSFCLENGMALENSWLTTSNSQLCATAAGNFQVCAAPSLSREQYSQTYHKLHRFPVPPHVHNHSILCPWKNNCVGYIQCWNQTDTTCTNTWKAKDAQCHSWLWRVWSLLLWNCQGHWDTPKNYYPGSPGFQQNRALSLQLKLWTECFHSLKRKQKERTMYNLLSNKTGDKQTYPWPWP